MKDIRSIHMKAMDLVKEANLSLEQGKKEEYLSLIKEAFVFENEAAMELVMEINAEPTRSVILRSAANLAYLSSNFIEADKLIHFALAGNPFEELRNEISELQNKVQQSLIKSISQTEIVENAYIEILRQKAINIRVEPKSQKFSKAIVLSYIIDFLKNIQIAYKNFSSVHFERIFKESDFENYNKVLKTFNLDTNLLAVDFAFKSFGVSLVSDTQIMNYNELYSQKFVDLKKNLFTDFKNDVLLPEYNDEQFKEVINEKYTEEERRRIYTPIIPSIIDKSPYNVSIANKTFSDNLKTFKPISRETKLFLSPALDKIDENEEINLVRKIQQKKGQKSTTIIVEQLKQAEFQIDISNINHDNKNVYLKDAHEITIVFSDNKYTINDEFYNIFVESHDYKEIIVEYNKAFIEGYYYLTSKEEQLDLKEKDLLSRFENNSLKDW